MSTMVTLTGRLGNDPELRFTSQGTAACNFDVCTSRRRKNPQTDEWEDTDTTWWRCTVWKDLAENVAESLQRGDAVVVYGKAKARSWEDKEGRTQTKIEVEAYNVGPDLKRATAKITRTARHTTEKGTPDDPWANPAPSGSDDFPF